jgi:hypothetical protein
MAVTDSIQPLAFMLEVTETSWSVAAPTPSLGSRTVSSPLADRSFRGWLADLRERSCRPLRRDDPQARSTEEFLRRLAQQVSGPLECRVAVRRRRRSSFGSSLTNKGVSFTSRGTIGWPVGELDRLSCSPDRSSEP